MLYWPTSNAVNGWLNNIVIIITSAKVVDAESVDSKGANTTNGKIWCTYVRSTYIRSIFSGDACTRATSIGSACIGSFFPRSACTKGIYLGGANTRGACTRDAWNTCTGSASTKDAYFAENVCIKGASTGSIYDSAYKSNKSSIEGLILLVESISKIPISFCLRLKVILDKVLYCYSTYLIYLLVYSLF